MAGHSGSGGGGYKGIMVVVVMSVWWLVVVVMSGKKIICFHNSFHFWVEASVLVIIYVRVCLIDAIS